MSQSYEAYSDLALKRVSHILVLRISQPAFYTHSYCVKNITVKNSQLALLFFSKFFVSPPPPILEFNQNHTKESRGSLHWHAIIMTKPQFWKVKGLKFQFPCFKKIAFKMVCFKIQLKVKCGILNMRIHSNIFNPPRNHSYN